MQATSIDTALNQSYITALLLTGSEERAEAAVAEGIQNLDLDLDPNAALLRASVNASLRQPPLLGWPSSEIAASLPPSLPMELRQVMLLPQQLRRCYVLRILIGWPRKLCATLLNLDLPTMDACLWDATRRLAVPRPA